MNYLKKLFIKNSFYGNKYMQLLYENSIHNFNNLDEMLSDEDYCNSIFCSLFYGNFDSRCKKNQSINTRLNNINEIEFHQIASEFEFFQRVNYYLHTIIFISFTFNILIYFHYLIN